MNSTDILIVGQGLAGTVLAWELLDRGMDVRIVDAGMKDSASWIAGGMINPISPRRPTKGWRAEELFPEAIRTYGKLERTLLENFLHQRPILRPFGDLEEKERWEKNAPEKGFDRFLLQDIPRSSERFPIDPETGSVAFQGGFLDLPSFLGNSREDFQKKGILHERNFDPGDLSKEKEGWKWEGLRTEKLILCQGTGMQNCPFFEQLPLRANKGEILTLEMPEFPEGLILNRGIYAIPIGEGKVRVGASYDHEDLTPGPTDQKRQELLQRMEAWIPFSYRVIDHRAGFRPTTPDTRPYVGFHPEDKDTAIFNGMGSKAVLLAPYWAKRFAEELLKDEGQSPDPEVDPFRFKGKEKRG